MGITLPFK